MHKCKVIQCDCDKIDVYINYSDIKLKSFAGCPQRIKTTNTNIKELLYITKFNKNQI